MCRVCVCVCILKSRRLLENSAAAVQRHGALTPTSFLLLKEEEEEEEENIFPLLHHPSKSNRLEPHLILMSRAISLLFARKNERTKEEGGDAKTCFRLLVLFVVVTIARPTDRPSFYNLTHVKHAI